MIEQNNYTETTEFNSSIATLMRVDFLIRQYQDLRRGLIPRDKFGFPVITMNPRELAISTLFNIKSECLSLMTKDEISKVKENEDKIDGCKFKYGPHLDSMYRTITKGMPPRELSNPNYYLGWKELESLADDYFLFLMNVLNIHGMLLTKKREQDEAPEEW
jgi:hypothetical protein